MLVDAGDGVVSQLLAAGIALESITQIALTHMHWDHILGYPALIWGSWNSKRSPTVIASSCMSATTFTA